MNEKIKRLLNGEEENYILPFFWQHGEEETVLRKYMEVIEKSNIKAVCVESRPHPDFCGPRWWHDMDIILDEARKRGMKVWILDDSHFPTGYANGAMEDAPSSLARKSLVYQAVPCKAGPVTLDLERFRRAKPWEPSAVDLRSFNNGKGVPEPVGEDEIVGISLIKAGGESEDDVIDLTSIKSGREIAFDVPEEGEWNIYICHSTRNCGVHRNYINMMDYNSCRVLIDAVYEPHYARYKDEFGKTIAGFFSDEPELGNGHLYDMQKHLSELDDLPWSGELEAALKEKWGEKYAAFLPLLWSTDFSGDMAAKLRFDYMDAVTRLVEKDFSWQLGDWCRAHGVEYIGHIIEDNNQHARTGTSLGHYFRGLYGQDMAGIDDIVNQVYPQGEEDATEPDRFGAYREGAFYHYVLGKLGSSAASIEPLKKGRAMCEIFGAYGWSEGVRLEKYLVDHFLVRGINYYVPHAFSPKKFPDPDCPPHFYAHGHNPQYRHFGALMKSLNRVCELMNGGRCVAPAAILYTGEAEWTGDFMQMQLPARELTDAQIDFEILPADVFENPKGFNAEFAGGVLKVNGQEYKVFIVPETKYLCEEAAKGIHKMLECGIPVIFINRPPKCLCGGGELPFDAGRCRVVELERLADTLKEMGIREVQVTPADNRLRYRHYWNGSDVYMFVNEGTETYKGSITVPQAGDVYAYNAWDNTLETVDIQQEGNTTALCVEIEPCKPLIVVFDRAESRMGKPLKAGTCGKKTDWSCGWTRSICKSAAYPAFEQEKEVILPDSLEREQPQFSGFVRYEKRLRLEEVPNRLILEITDAYEGVEVFVNGVSAGIQVVPAYRYDLTRLLNEGENRIRIEVATTLERATVELTGQTVESAAPSGINGCVFLYGV